MFGNLDYKDHVSRLSKRSTINVNGLLIVSSIAGVIIGLPAGLGAVSGIITNYFLGSYIASLSPFIIGGIIGFGLPLLVVGFLRSLISNPSLGDSIKKVPKLIINSCPEFGIGMGLVALGFTSPAAIGALSLLFGVVARTTIAILVIKFTPDTNIEIGNMESNSRVILLIGQYPVTNIPFYTKLFGYCFLVKKFDSTAKKVCQCYSISNDSR